jgi:hypothetical protein
MRIALFLRNNKLFQTEFNFWVVRIKRQFAKLSKLQKMHIALAMLIFSATNEE